MSSDAALIIPHLSKELNLIGHSELPFTLEKISRKKHNRKGDDEYKVIFDTKLMITSLTNVCFELVKQIKTFGIDDNNELDKLNFENSRLEKLLKSSKLDVEKQKNEITSLKLANQQLQEKVDNLEKKSKEYKISLQSLTQKNQTNEDTLKHALKKNEMYISNLHKAVWKQFNMADENYFLENFKLVQLNQPNFDRLWSTVKYSEAKTRESALKQAVCMLQNNNRSLMEENFLLKTTLLSTVNQITDTVKELGDRLNLSESMLSSLKISDIFMNVEEFNSGNYNNIVNNYLKIIRRFNELFDSAQFSVDDDVFICWSKIINEF